MPLKYRIIAKTLLFLGGFRLYRAKFGDAGFWMISNKPMPKTVYDEDVVFLNNSAKSGQIRKATLICKGDAPKIRCEWKYETG